MFRHLLVPLDGSKLAESVLPVAEYLSKILHIDITLIHIIEKDAPEKIHGQLHLTSKMDAEKYLKNIAAGEQFKGSKVEYHVHESSVEDLPRSIVDHSKELQNDLVLLSTHGKGGLKEMVYGSIAQKVISKGTTPVLLIYPEMTNIKNYNCRNILVPVDGNSEHERSLNYAVEFAKLTKSSLHFLMAVPEFGNLAGEWTSSSRFLPNTSTRMMDMLVNDAAVYLKNIENKFSGEGIPLQSTVSRKDPPSAIYTAVNDTAADLVVLGTHGKKGTQAFWSGSITPKIGKNVHVPLLLIPIHKTEDNAAGV